MLLVYNDVIYNETLVGELDLTDQCRESLSELVCGLWMPSCINGEKVPVCRENCEGNGTLFVKAACFSKKIGYLLLSNISLFSKLTCFPVIIY